MLEEIWKGREDTLLAPRLSRIRAQTQVIWGQYDRVRGYNGVLYNAAHMYLILPLKKCVEELGQISFRDFLEIVPHLHPLANSTQPMVSSTGQRTAHPPSPLI